MELKRKCEICGEPMSTRTFQSTAAETWFIEYKCPKCNATTKEIAVLAMEKDNKRILEILDYLEDVKEGEVPWPEE